MFLFITYILFFVNANSALLTVEQNVPEEHFKCLNSIKNTYFNSHIIIISTVNKNINGFVNYNKNSTVVILSNSSKFNFKAMSRKFNCFIMILDNAESFRSILKLIYNTAIWNSRGKYLIGYKGSEDLNELFAISWQYFILNIIIVDFKNTGIYTYFPYNESCGYKTYNLINNCSNLTTEDLYPEKVPYRLANCDIRLMAYPMIPYVTNISAPHENPSLAGLELTILHLLKERMNFNEIFVSHNYDVWGYRDLDGIYHGMFGSLYNRDCDLILGMTFGNASHLVDFDGSFVYLIDAAVWWVPAALPIPQWSNLTAIFQPIVWLTIFLTFIVNGIAWWIVGRRKEVNNFYNDPVLSVMASLCSLLQGSTASPSTWRLRLIFIIWMMMCLLLFTAHQCQLVSILTSPLYEHQINSVEELVKSTLSYGMYVGAALGFEEDENPAHQIIYKNYIRCPLTTYCLNLTAFNRNFAFLRNLRNTRYFLPRFYTTLDGKSLLYQLEDARIGIWVRYHMLKGFPLLDRFNHLLMLMESNGLIAKWDKDITFFILRLESKPDHVSLTISHLQGAFYILFMGLFVANFVFVCEMLQKLIASKIYAKKSHVK